MNSITKIGKIALSRYFTKKPAVCNDEAIVSKVVFSEKTINIFNLMDCNFAKQSENYKFYKMWSIELGIVDLCFKQNQTLYSGIVRKLKKLQKDDSPSHLIVSESVRSDKTTTIVYTIYRLTEEQELAIFYDGLLPSINKRDAKMQSRAIIEQENWEKYYKEYLAK